MLGDYNAVMQRRPAELGMEWQFEYAVDAPVVVPDLISPQSEEDKQRFMQHIKDLGAKVTHELLATIKTGK